MTSTVEHTDQLEYSLAVEQTDQLEHSRGIKHTDQLEHSPAVEHTDWQASKWTSWNMHGQSSIQTS